MATTGDTLLPNLGKLSYNGVDWSCLYKSTVNFEALPDEAKRTTKAVKATLEVEGYVTLRGAAKNTDQQMRELRLQLEQHAGALVYSGNGSGDLNVNTGVGVRDLMYGPVPRVLFFQPLGGGRGAFIRWTVECVIPATKLGIINPVMQFNFESQVTYDDEGYSQVSIHGTLEIGATRTTQETRQVEVAVGQFRASWLNIQFDLTKFRVTRRNFTQSRDGRTMEWEFAAEELPPMGLPLGATKATGTMTVRPIKLGGGGGSGVTGSLQAGITWACSLRCTYTIRADYPRRMASLDFYAMLWYRMAHVEAGAAADVRAPANAAQQPGQQPLGFFERLRDQADRALFGPPGPNNLPNNELPRPGNQAVIQAADATRQMFIRAGAIQARSGSMAVLNDFSFTEGLYLDSKTITFEASWFLLTSFSTILLATGLWRAPGRFTGGGAWATTVQDIMGWRSVLVDRLNRNNDVIVDLGMPAAPPGISIGGV